MLVVEDDADTAEALRRLLSRHGHEAHVSTEPWRALLWLSEQDPPPHLIVLDWMMPGINGGDVLRSLRSDPAYRGIKVVVFSAAYESERLEEARRFGADDYIVKGTIGWDAVIRRLERHLGETGANPPVSDNGAD